MPVIYQVRDWAENFENDRSRTRQKCSFVCVPNKQHGMSFCRIMNEPDGAAIYGIWCLILGACSQQSASNSLPRHGWLTNNGDYTGRAWGSYDLAMKFRRPEAEIQRALDVLSSDDISWLIKHEPSDLQELAPCHRQLTAQSPPTPLEGNRIEENRRGKGMPPNLGLSTTEKISSERELGRIGDELKKLEGSYDEHRTWSAVDRMRRAELKERKSELLTLLGMKA